jgi:3-aminobutyryl-CoA ammonia-lyase
MPASSDAPSATAQLETSFRLRIGAENVHYRNELVAGAFLLQLFGDLGSELTIRLDGDAGLLRAYEEVEFFQPVFTGDFLELRAKLVHCGKTSRKIEYTAHKYIQMKDGGPWPSSGRLIDPPLLVARAIAVAVVPADRQRKTE